MDMARCILVIVALIFQAAAEASALAGALHDPVAMVATGGKWGFINRKGDFLFDRQFESVGKFSEGLAAVQVGGKVGFIDIMGSR
jgi:hypothetical protein